MQSNIDGGDVTKTDVILLRGVENFQVLYGTDSIAPNNIATTSTPDSLPDRYLRADELTVPNNLTATYFNWRRVRSVRIGLVMRSAPGQSNDTNSATFFPFGVGKASSASSAGTALSSANDTGTTSAENTFTDTRYRRSLTFTIHLRNDQGS